MDGRELGSAWGFQLWVPDKQILTKPYINIKKDGKYGYINPTGQLTIDFKYDYASPFVRIKAFDKNFEVALVEEAGKCKIILKNEREVLTYKSESGVDNYAAKSKELQDIYYNTLKQSGEMTFEIDNITEMMNKVKVYENDNTEGKNYTYRYNYNNDWDILITTSTLGGDDKYELQNKKDRTYRFQLDAKALDYDDKYVYIFSKRVIVYPASETILETAFSSSGVFERTSADFFSRLTFAQTPSCKLRAFSTRRTQCEQCIPSIEILYAY